jgi:hypothetical protein
MGLIDVTFDIDATVRIARCAASSGPSRQDFEIRGQRAPHDDVFEKSEMNDAF